MNRTPTVLVVLDGFGHSTTKKWNAIAQARTPHLNAWLQTYPHTLLKASGSAVGLLDGMIGNSEVGHLTLGAGRVISQPIKNVHTMIDTNTLRNNQALMHALQETAHAKKTVHFLGLLSDAGVHSHEKHLYALIDLAHECGVADIVVHPFLDGRDVPPQSAATYLERLAAHLQKVGGTIGSLHGRFYAMDRDSNWQRTQQTYDVLTRPQKNVHASWQEVLDTFYKQKVTDEFVPPTQLDASSIIQPHDTVLFFNVRPDRARQLTAALTDASFKVFEVDHMPLRGITMTNYNHNNTLSVVLETSNVSTTFFDVLEENNYSIFTIAETEKYAHVTYFFGGGVEQQRPHETRVLIPSIKTDNYAEHPCMSAPQITQAVCYSLETSPADFYLINYANADMVGHSGNLNATIKAVECLDEQLGILFDRIVKTMGGTLYITADHGNAESMFDEESQQPRTAHTTNPVPFIMLKDDIQKGATLPLKELADVAPFILAQMGLPVPHEMRNT